MNHHTLRRLAPLAAGLLFVIAGADASAKPAGHYAGEKLAGSAKVTMAQARQIALKARPGAITDQELEKEGGGSGLRYSFDIKSGGKTYEVGVDAKTGAVLENGAEGKNPD
jgi:uncharacterized membrane protein YkoI